MTAVGVGVGVGFRTKVNRPYPNAADNVVAAWTAAGSTPDSATETRIRALVNSLINRAVWGKIYVLYLFKTPTEPVARINWISPGTNNLTPINSPIHTPNSGIAGDGVSACYDTGWTPPWAGEGSLNGYGTLAGYVVSNTNTSNPDLVTQNSRSALHLGSASTSPARSVFGRIRRTNGPNPQTALASHFSAVTRIGGRQTVYINGAAAMATTLGGSQDEAGTLRVLGDPVANVFSNRKLGAALAAAELTADEHSDLSAAISAFMV